MILKKLPIIFAICLTLFLFLFLRWYKIDQSFFFFNDMGRDFLVLYDWQQSGKPPLLGPQTSALPFNQSAFYFYLFYPFFILLKHSPYTTLVTLNFLYLSAFALALYFFRKQKHQLLILIFTAFIFAIHPQVIIQNKFVWNPSFVPLFLMAAYFFFLNLQKKFNQKNLFFFALSLALAVGMSLSALPALLALMMLSVIVFRKEPKKILFIILAVGLAHLLVFLPYVAFEIKYKFQIIRRILSQGASLKSTDFFTLTSKISRLSSLLLPSFKYSLFFLISIIGAAIYSIIKNKEILKSKIFQSSFLFLATSILTIFSPFNIEAHYIFGSLTFFILLIANLPKKIALLVTSFCIIFWLNPSSSSSYFQPAPRTVSLLETCFTNFCAKNPEPIYVSVQAGFHNYHNGPEFRYLMKEKGCLVKNIEDRKNDANKMAVVVDGGQYVHNQNKYDELSLFGPSQEIDVFSCASNFRIHVLEK